MVSYFIGEDTINLRPEFWRQTLTCWNSRIVPGFLVQTGDKTGTGGGGESIYGGAHAINIFPCICSITEVPSQNLLKMKFTPDYVSPIVD